MLSREPARFEYRVWSEGLHEISARVRTASQEAALVSGTETYLLSPATVTINPKVRQNLLDVKILVDEIDGFERWDVHSKRDFPLAAGEIADLIGLLGTGPVNLERRSYDLRHLIAEVVDPHPDLLAADVTKERELRTIGRCRAEITDVIIDGISRQTVAIESADLSELAALRANLGLDRHPNVSYPRAILSALEISRHGN